MNRMSGAALGGLALLALAGCAGTTTAQDRAPAAPSATLPAVAVAAASAAAAPAKAPSTTVPPSATAPTSTTVSPSTAVPATVPRSTIVPAATTTPPTTVAAGPVVRSGADLSPDREVGEPLSISIPDIGVSGPVVATGLLPDGTVDVPADADVAGWFTGGPRPGERGPAVIMGHVDSRRTGPGVFYHLADLQVGAIATVETTSGPQHFVVRSVEQYPKEQFPTDLVYGAEPGSTLRLITCGGSFDRSIRHYRDNIVAFLVRTEI